MRVFEILSSEYGYGADTHSWGNFKNFSEILSVIFEIDKSDKLNINRVINTLKKHESHKLLPNVNSGIEKFIEKLNKAKVKQL